MNNGVDLTSSDCVVGAGDLYTEWYAGYHKPCWYLDMLVGSKIPTGKKTCDAGRVYWQSTGNNGHFEFRGGFEGGARRSWIAVRGMATYSYAFDHTEMRAPAFVGATIKNIPVGPSVPTRVHWGYFWGNLDITIFPTKCDHCGFVLGYELYAKQHDKVCFCSSTAQDFLGYTHPLDDEILEQGTDTRLNKIRGEVSMRHAKRHCLVEFDVLLDAQPSVVRLHAEFMDADVVARGHGPHPVKYAFSPRLARHGVDDNIGPWQRAVHSIGSRLHKFPGVLEG